MLGSKRVEAKCRSCNYDVYIVVTPSVNALGTTAIQQLRNRLSVDSNFCRQSSLSTDSVGNLGRRTLIVGVNYKTLQECESKLRLKSIFEIPTNLAVCIQQARRILRTICCLNDEEDSGGREKCDLTTEEASNPIFATDGFEYDPFAVGSAENCVRRILEYLISREESETTEKVTTIDIRMKGILFNPYGCPQLQRRQSGVEANEDAAPHIRTRPLADYKFLSIAKFLDAARSMRRIKITVPTVGGNDDDMVTLSHPQTKVLVERNSRNQSSMRVVIVGSEAARGLPRMGIPVPEIDEGNEDSIKHRLLLSDVESKGFYGESKNWESEYAEMNALAVLYFKKLAQSTDFAGDYLAVVSPGMTCESLKIEHVPKSGRTPSLRFKLWVCRLPWIFDWLRRHEISKTKEEGAAILIRSLLNDPVGVYDSHTPNLDSNVTRWDDLYPNGSFVGAKSGTGGPLCEQSRLVYNATTKSVHLSDNDNKEQSKLGNLYHGNDMERNEKGVQQQDNGYYNFLANPQLQNEVYQIVRDILNKQSNQTIP